MTLPCRTQQPQQQLLAVRRSRTIAHHSRLSRSLRQAHRQLVCGQRSRPQARYSARPAWDDVWTSVLIDARHLPWRPLRMMKPDKIHNWSFSGHGRGPSGQYWPPAIKFTLMPPPRLTWSLDSPGLSIPSSDGQFEPFLLTTGRLFYEALETLE